MLERCFWQLVSLCFDALTLLPFVLAFLLLGPGHGAARGWEGPVGRLAHTTPRLTACISALSSLTPPLQNFRLGTCRYLDCTPWLMNLVISTV